MQEADASTGCAALSLEFDGGPWEFAEHLGEDGEVYGDDAAVGGEVADGFVEELFGFRRPLVWIFGQFAEELSEGREDIAGVGLVEEGECLVVASAVEAEIELLGDEF